jgi:DNA-binding LacI/PurR family transcriptional regulator
MRQDFLTRFPWNEFSGVACNTGFYKPPLHLVMPDHAHAVKRAFQEAQRRGYQRIGMILFDEPNAIDDFDKVSAFLYCQSCLPPNMPRIPVSHISLSDKSAITAWLHDNRPDCVLGINNLVWWWLIENQLRVPEDVAFVSLMANLEEAQDLAEGSESPSKQNQLTMLDHCAESLGQTALEYLDILLRTNQRGIPAQPITMMVEARWLERASLPERETARAAVAVHSRPPQVSTAQKTVGGPKRLVR